MTESTQMIIAEDHPLIAKGLIHLINQIEPKMEITTTDTGSELLSLAKKMEPKYFIIDLLLNDGVSIGCVENLLSLYPDVKIFIYTTFPGAIYAKRLFKIGISGFLNKMAKEEEVKIGIVSFLNNEFYVSPEFLPQIFSQYKSFDASKINPFEFLSDRELTLVECLREEMALKDIAVKMGIKPNTAATYKKRAYQKLGVENLIQLINLYQDQIDRKKTETIEN